VDALSARAAVRRMGIIRPAGLFAALSLAVLQGCAVYNTTSEGADSDLMLLGYDPVSYVEAAQPAKGRAELNARHRHGSYRFVSQANREKFASNPDRYAPQYGGFCAKGGSYAIRAGGDPLVYEIRAGRLFIFVNNYARDYWRTDPADFVSKADGYWSSELEDAPVKWTNLKRFVFRVPHYKTYAEEFADYERRTGKAAPNRR
jgi:YHS domain-containing protein